MATGEPKQPGLNARDTQAAALIATGRDRAQVAEALGISVSSVARIIAKPAFARLVRELRHEAVAALLGAFSEGAREAATELRRLIKEATSKDGPRVSACRAVLDYALKVYEAVDLKSELEELRAELKQRDEPKLPVPETGAQVRQTSAPTIPPDGPAPLFDNP
jgi:hypothetical protein